MPRRHLTSLLYERRLWYVWSIRREFHAPLLYGEYLWHVFYTEQTAEMFSVWRKSLWTYVDIKNLSQNFYIEKTSFRSFTQGRPLLISSTRKTSLWFYRGEDLSQVFQIENTFFSTSPVREKRPLTGFSYGVASDWYSIWWWHRKDVIYERSLLYIDLSQIFYIGEYLFQSFYSEKSCQKNLYGKVL